VALKKLGEALTPEELSILEASDEAMKQFELADKAIGATTVWVLACLGVASECGCVVRRGGGGHYVSVPPRGRHCGVWWAFVLRHTQYPAAVRACSALMLFPVRVCCR
jgi:hypothetical protein